MRGGRIYLEFKGTSSSQNIILFLSETLSHSSPKSEFPSLLAWRYYFPSPKLLASEKGKDKEPVNHQAWSLPYRTFRPPPQARRGDWNLQADGQRRATTWKIVHWDCRVLQGTHQTPCSILMSPASCKRKEEAPIWRQVHVIQGWFPQYGPTPLTRDRDFPAPH
jgi:hypothetical protein